ncbi:MAG: competence protein ComFC, partial [Bacteroidota bacterium]
IKLGKAPHTYYKLNSQKKDIEINFSVQEEQSEFLLQHFLLITETGIKLEGMPAFKYWCDKQKLPIEKTLTEFITTRKKYLAFYNVNHLIEGTQKLADTKGYEKIGIDKLFYLDFYAIERFGKTRLGTLMHFAKQGQNKKLMSIIVSEIKSRVENFIKMNKINAVLFVPPTIKRELQIMLFLQTHLQLNIPLIGIKKITGEIAIPQKALSKLHERISNAQNSFVVTEKQKFKTVLIIDDAVGSGATINEIAEKIRQKKVAKTIYGLAITGSYKGFEVINEI